MKEQILIMLDLQDAMNRKVNDDWVNQEFSWYRAIWVECAELMDHYGWKWWKKQTPDAEQVKLELVDIWHFGLSILLLESNSREDISSNIAKQLLSSKPSGDFRDDLESFTFATLQSKSFDIAGFSSLMTGIGLTFDELYVSYVGKNVLNFFRQDNGYQDGSYRKVWSGKEDNEHLVELIGEMDKSSKNFKDNLYLALENRYSESGR